MLTLLLVYLVPSGSPLSPLNYIFGFVFVTFIPGYCLVNILFATRENKLDRIEEVVLSVALSFGMVGLAGLFLGLSPIGINFNSIRISLAGIVLVMASAAYLRKRHFMRVSSAKI
jgi:uncharacterized membrane protein